MTKITISQQWLHSRATWRYNRSGFEASTLDAPFGRSEAHSAKMKEEVFAGLMRLIIFHSIPLTRS